jgi:hypothetical protein
MRELGASTIALDIIFAEADRYDGTASRPTKGWPILFVRAGWSLATR